MFKYVILPLILIGVLVFYWDTVYPTLDAGLDTANERVVAVKSFVAEVRGFFGGGDQPSE